MTAKHMLRLHPTSAQVLARAFYDLPLNFAQGRDGRSLGGIRRAVRSLVARGALTEYGELTHLGHLLLRTYLSKCRRCSRCRHKKLPAYFTAQGCWCKVCHASGMAQRRKEDRHERGPSVGA